MHPPSLSSAGCDAGPLDQRSRCLVVDIGLSCPSCRVQLSLPSAFLGQVVTGPCPVCGSTLVFCHGRIERAPQPGATAMRVEDEKPVVGSRVRLLRSGTVGVHYLENQGAADAVAESKWGVGRGGNGSQAEASVPAPDAGFRRACVWGGGVVMGLLAVGSTLWLWRRATPATPAPRAAAPGTGVGARALTPGWGDGALAAWRAFLQAATAEEKLEHVMDASRVAPTLRAFYQAHPAGDGEWAERTFRPLAGTLDDRRRGVVALGFSPTMPGERPMIIFFRVVTPPSDDDGASTAASTAPRFLLDWETYIQESRQLAESFVLNPAPGRRVLRLAIERVHLFGEAGEGPTRAEPLGLKLRTPSGLLLPGEAHVRAGSPLFDRLDAQLRWGMTVYATVQLDWNLSRGQPPRLMATDLVCWHFPGLGGTPEFEIDLSPLPPASPARSSMVKPSGAEAVDPPAVNSSPPL